MATADAQPLTAFSRGAGCGCKLSALELNAAISAMRSALPTSPDVLVSASTSDDAGVVRIADDLALVQTLDFFTPIVDDAYTWGRIAATNALSDVYAMGGRPITAMNIVGWPRDVLPWTMLSRVLDGAADVVREADCALVGGHSIDDAEPKFGLSVTGIVHPNHMLTNASGRPGDVLVMTKPLGVGLVTTAVKRGIEGVPEQVAIDWMTTSNRTAAEAAIACDVRCATDITGFGFVGHLGEILAASDLDAEIALEAVPMIEGVRDLAAAGVVPGGTLRNLDAFDPADWGTVDPVDRLVLSDAQTSGGLLLAVAASAAPRLLEELGGDRSWEIGCLRPRRRSAGAARITFA